MYDHSLQPSFGGSSLHYPLINGVGGDKAIDHYWLSLTNAMAAILSLQVTLGILMGKERWSERERESECESECK